MSNGIAIRAACAIKLAENADRSGGPDSCWIWTKSCICGFGKEENTQRGYGQMGGGTGKDRWHRLAHRAAMEIFLGRDLAKGECILHRCDNPPCCNPAHLFLGDRNDNAQDKMAKGRHNYRTHNGSRHGMSKVTESQVVELRLLYAARKATQVELAAKYGISQANISDIIRRRTWNHV